MRQLVRVLILSLFGVCVAAGCSDSGTDDDSMATDSGLDAVSDGYADAKADTSTPPDLSVEASVDSSVTAACGPGGGSKNGSFDISGTVTNSGTESATNTTCEFTAEATSTPPDGTIASGTLEENITVEGMGEASFSGQFTHSDGCQTDYDISVTVECVADNEPTEAVGSENEVTETTSF